MPQRKRKILILDGHPDIAVERLVHALGRAYGAGAEAGGHEVRTVALATLAAPMLHSQAEWETDAVPAAIRALQQDLLWADHLVLMFPLWLGDMPGLLKGLLEQVLRPGFAFAKTGARLRPRLGPRSARIIVTMGMPAIIYRLCFGAHAVKLLKRSIFGLVGIRPAPATLIGRVEGRGVAERALRRIAALGRKGR